MVQQNRLRLFTCRKRKALSIMPSDGHRTFSLQQGGQEGIPMVEIVARVSSKNQVTLPADVRRRLGIGASDRVAFILDDNGGVELRPVQQDIKSFFGFLKPLPNQSLDFEREIEEATAEEIDRRRRHP
jgi:AbrB family looped-hinge helix DNA binding protein